MRTLPHAVGGEVDDPVTSAIAFKAKFRAEHGAQMPDFLETSHKEALRSAQNQLKFLFVYLHSPTHADAHTFCRDVLTDPGVLAALNQNFVCWGGDVRKTDAFQLAAGVAASTFPYGECLRGGGKGWARSLVGHAHALVRSFTRLGNVENAESECVLT